MPPINQPGFINFREAAFLIGCSESEGCLLAFSDIRWLSHDWLGKLSRELALKRLRLRFVLGVVEWNKAVDGRA